MLMPVVTGFNVDALSQMDSTGMVVFVALDDALFFQRRFSFELALFGYLVVFGGFIAWRVDIEGKRISRLSSRGNRRQT